ncbi:multiubiquitin domain-containing protein [Gemmatimonas sp. UBA7669]|uniref:multiubiquitin domain-containing protein n=1 Tax=Gemmatimonas sp. UBA7669 TaxID=1946568 RepID=UPI0025BA92E2|nr:multiubiquitin domain-containing protein [Gemmatimonas sp. UBA7669]
MHPSKPIHVFINKVKYELASPVTTGAALKALAGLAAADVLFLQQPREDEVIANDQTITLKNGDHLHSQPPADYGAGPIPEIIVALERELEGHSVTLHQGPDCWTYVVIAGYRLPSGYDRAEVELLVKLAPSYPDAAPDMFWVSPALHTASGALPRATTTERLLGRDWQRYSWHLASGTWTPGVSTMRDFLRAVAARFQRLD